MNKPKLIGNIQIPVKETFSYLYMPIKFPGEINPVYEERLSVVSPLIGSSCCDFIGDFGLDRYVQSYVYLTCHHLFQAEHPFNRPGWHTDGFGTPDINYIWSNKQPTVFNSTDFTLSADDQKSMVEMEEQALRENDYSYPDNSLVRIDPSVVHKVGEFIPGMRCFFKLSFSKDKYNLEGNTKNYKIDYDWKMRQRSQIRNTPQENINGTSS